MGSDSKLMADITPFGLRMPPDLKEIIEAAAKANHRSLNAEIIHRLKSSYPTDRGAEMTIVASRGSDQFKLRLPDGLRDEIKEAAKANGRSMNAEIVSRLQGSGKTLRDEFAGLALAGWLASFPPDAAVKPNNVAAFAYEVADAMLAARQQQGGGND